MTDLPDQVSGCCVAFSGGMDSSALLHLLANPEAGLVPPPLRAIHVNHGLHPDAGRWAQHCMTFCAKLGVPLTVLTETVPRDGGLGLEAAARSVRYAALGQQLRTDEWLLTAHHEEDQLETVLLRLFRGAGVDGLGGIASGRRFGKGWLQRPLLTVPKAEIVKYASRTGFDWLEDPGNAELQLDRNYLRRQVVPLLRARWPGVAATAARTARLAQDASAVLDEFASADSATATRGDVIDLSAFRKLSAVRQRNMLRFALKRRDFEMPSDSQLRVGIEQLLSAGPDRQPVMSWAGGQVRRYRERLYILASDPDSESRNQPATLEWTVTDRPLELGHFRGSLRLESSAAGGLRLPAEPLCIRYRDGGERIRGVGHQHRASLKKLFQDWGILPWMRPHIPLVYAGARLVSVAGLLTAAEASTAPGEPGYRIIWEGHGPYREQSPPN